MKVFHVTLLIVGLVAAASSSSESVIYNLKNNLDSDIKGIQIRSDGLIHKVYYHLQEDVPAFLLSPFTGSSTLISHVTNDAQDVIESANADIRTMKYHIQTAINELYPGDYRKKDVLEILIQRLEEAGRVAAVKKEELLQLASSHALADASLIASVGPEAARGTVTGHVNQDFNFYVSNVKDFIDQVERSVRDAFMKLL